MISLLRIGSTDQSLNRAQRVQPSKGGCDISIDQFFAVAVLSDLFLYGCASLIDVSKGVLELGGNGRHLDNRVYLYT